MRLADFERGNRIALHVVHDDRRDLGVHELERRIDRFFILSADAALGLVFIVATAAAGFALRAWGPVSEDIGIRVELGLNCAQAHIQNSDGDRSILERRIAHAAARAAADFGVGDFLERNEQGAFVVDDDAVAGDVYAAFDRGPAIAADGRLRRVVLVESRGRREASGQLYGAGQANAFVGGAAEAERGSLLASRGGATERQAGGERVVGEAAAHHDAFVGVPGRTKRDLSILAQLERREPVGRTFQGEEGTSGPLPNIADQIVKAKALGLGRQGSHPHGLLASRFALGGDGPAGLPFGPPRELPRFFVEAPAGGGLELVLGGQPKTGPGGVLLSLFEGDVDHGEPGDALGHVVFDVLPVGVEPIVGIKGLGGGRRLAGVDGLFPESSLLFDVGDLGALDVLARPRKGRLGPGGADEREILLVGDLGGLHVEGIHLDLRQALALGGAELTPQAQLLPRVCLKEVLEVLQGDSDFKFLTGDKAHPGRALGVLLAREN